nr:helicase with zinc finger domain 2-like [Paramormyrops kingsleyae]XP_023651079.1 helicase with zinc finger domain 2-like [Paramormyrops kingsleyae]XP_023651080.1 helicase with zinc finger domain 2-like [Paramormyrops kingsleyae]
MPSNATNMTAAEQDTSVLKTLLEICDLKIACSTCASKENEITYLLRTTAHQCHGDILLAKAKGNGKRWRYISRRPQFPNPSKYCVCYFFVEGLGCTKHHNRCTFATSNEEVMVWNFQKRNKMDHSTLIKLLASRRGDAQKRADTAGEILAEFGGQFRELCGACFRSSPQRIADKRWNNTCTGEAAHTWSPILTHCLEEQSKKVYNEIRHRSLHGFQVCAHVARGFPCWHRFSSCPFAHSEVEMAVWKEEVTGKLHRQDLILLSQRKQLSDTSSAAKSSPALQYYCKACLLTVSSQESFIKHCASLEHTMMITEDFTAEWKHRPPPQNCKPELCDRPKTCDYGHNCTRAHSAEELTEWIMRHKEAEEIRSSAEAQGLMSYRELLLQEYRNSSNEVHIISDYVDDVIVTHDKDLSVECEKTGTLLKWIFQIKTERLLGHIALLKQEPGSTFSLGEISPEGPCIYATGEKFCTSDMSFEVPVFFTSINPGLYEQWLVFDFNMRPVLLQKLQVRVGEHMLPLPEEMPMSVRPLIQDLKRWHRGNRFIIPCTEKKEEEEELLKEYKPPQMNLQFNPKAEDHSPLTRQNYRERMHNFLYREELALEEVVSRLSLKTTISLPDKIYGDGFGMKFAPAGELFAEVPVHFSLTPDTPEGYVLRRSVCSALVAPASAANQNNQVYEADIVRDASSENMMYLQLSKRCCHDMGLQSNMTCAMEVQFQISRLPLCEMHKAVDLLPEVEMVLPDMDQCCVPVHAVQYTRLNAKQQTAMSFILGESDGRRSVAPLLIYGPFGTGKTYTLATAAKELVRQPGTRVLICTHTNSSADLYVKDHFHLYVNAGNPQARPLRIKANKKGVVTSATDDITVQYCHLSTDGQFLFPDKATVDKFKIVITTAAMARLFHDLKLPSGYFSHIMIDEASQMLECEALMPLSLAGKGTRVVLAGDHMQMGPKLFSVQDGQCCAQTLLNHLFRYYQEDKNLAASRSRIIFNENYRSTKEIVDFVSTYFYVGKSDAIKASGAVPPHPHHHPLKFQHVRGQCRLDSTTMSWFNPDEITSVVQVVKSVLEEWPPEWGNRDQRTICVLSEGCQVPLIRKALRRTDLSRVTVENLENVQGKQFRVVVMSTVHTRDSLLSSDSAYLDFFNDARVLNTAMTRAQSQVIVVGDAVALCMFGRCTKIWKSYTGQCIGKGSMNPPHLTVDFIEQEVWEISRFQRVVNECDADVEYPAEEPNVDEILQELTEDHSIIEDGALLGDHPDGVEQEHFSVQHKAFYSETEKNTLLEMVALQPTLYKHGELVLEHFDRGYVMPYVNHSTHIVIKGKTNIGKSFSGDEVVVEIYKENGHDFGKVLGITKKAEASRVFVCTLEDSYNKKSPISDKVTKVFVPINQNATKIRVLVNKKNPNLIPIWRSDNGNWNIMKSVHFNEKTKHDHVFVVEVIRWKENNIFPLGNVTDIYPIGKSLDAALNILDKEFRLVSQSHHVLTAAQVCSDTEKEEITRMDLRDILTFTVDPKHAKVLDDAISVQDFNNCYELGVHITDVASFVSRGSLLDLEAKKMGATFYVSNEERRFMLPKPFSIHQCSFLPGQDRRAISLIIKVEKATNQIVKHEFVLSRIRSDHQLTYEEAEDIIEGTGIGGQLKDYVTIAYHFSKAHRKARLLEDWCYAQPDECRPIGRRKSHQMIEELMIMFNSCVSEFLIGLSETEMCTPLRCQEKLTVESVRALQEKYQDLIPLSTHLRYHIGSHCNQSRNESFCILTSLWEELQSAAQMRKSDKVIDLIATDNIHPHLHPATSELRNLLGKSYVVRSNSAPKSKVGHYSLQLNSYTLASSPLRRYLDIIIQRLLHGVLTNTPIQYSPQEIDILCQQFENKNKTANAYKKKAEELSVAINLRQQNSQKLAFVSTVDPDGESFRLSFPFNNDLQDTLPIMYRDLQLEDQPVFEKEHVTLAWKRRIYSISTTSNALELKRFQRCNPCTSVPQKAWLNLVEAVRMEDWKMVNDILMSTTTKPMKESSEAGNREKHFVNLAFNLKPGDILEVQMTSEQKQGFFIPIVQLLNVNADFEVCLEHTHNPVMCFSTSAEHAARSMYRNVDEYVKIWKPLCEMESAANAVDESDSIIIEDVELTWKQGVGLEGSFFLPNNCIKDWAIECSLARCYLCIRKRNIKHDCSVNCSEINVEVDPKKFTWVAHGFTTRDLGTKKNSKNKVKEVEFYINYMSMNAKPQCVFQENTKFTVELIPKLLPNIRQETAVISLKNANDLVQKIALGKQIPRAGSESSLQKWEIIRFQPSGLPELNESQRDAIEKAMRNSFTLIQGPPGTGKTVVGAYIVYWFLKLNSRTPRYFEDPVERAKAEVILYCGPSNKSVDVVAEYLMKFEKKLKLLRVYSRQIEMLEYPYPGSIIQLSRKSLRQEHSKPELRLISMHHRIREGENPFSSEIRDFDERIRSEEQMTDNEVEEYKKLLNKARLHELRKHDVILCTCTAASTPNITKSVSARQILIDESAMATEPQTLVPLVSHNPEKIVLIGDHKQLRPIVKNLQVRHQGMARSLFERYFKQTNRTIMLDTQYRMHKDICEFPSTESYNGQLKTEVNCPPSVLQASNRRRTHILFGHITGEEVSLIVTTEKGNENSKANREESDIAVHIAESLVNISKVRQEDIAVLSPYNAQVAGIKKQLTEINMDGITVCTITKSQGSEWRYVILSTVRSCPSAKIEKDPSRPWLSKYVGFVGDPNQVNVGITRARQGLCIIGNQELLRCSPIWNRLLKHYTANSCVVGAEEITVHGAA